MHTSNGKLPPPEQAFEWPREAVKVGNWVEAARRWAVVREAYPDHPTTWFQGAYAHMEAGEVVEADTLLAHTRQHFPDHPNVLWGSAALEMRRHEWGLAEEFLRQARERFPKHPPTWLQSAELAEAKGDLEQAEEYFRYACKSMPDRPGLFVQYAELAMRHGQWAEALERWKVVREKFPDIPAGLHRAAEAARQLGRHRDARKLVLASQYGADILDDTAHSQNSPKKRGNHGSMRHLLGIIRTKAIFNLRSEVHRNYLSYGWWLLEPILHMAVYYVVFGILLQRGGEDYPVFLLTGLIPWMWFLKAVSASSNSILGGQNLMLQVGLPPIVFPLVSILQSTLKQIPVFVLLFGFVWMQGYSPDIHWWGLIPVIVVQGLLIIAVACAVAALIPFVRDLSYVVPTGLTLLMFLSGIFYSYRSIAAEWQELFLLNPVAFLLKCYREVLIEGVLPELSALAWWGAGSAAACLLLMFVYQSLRYTYPRIVTE